ncbi:MAG: LacI family DNA-binding transcriptional regulator [Sphaerochaeta sp.]
MAATRDSVAKKAGVSSATVSRVYNNPAQVSPVLASRVLEAAIALGYEPNSVAASLRRSGTGTLAFVQFKKENRPYYWGNLESFDWFYARAIRGMQEVLAQSSWQMRFYTVGSAKDLEAVAKRCDGILAYDVDTKEEESYFSSISIPFVLAHHTSGLSVPYNTVRTDNVHGGRLQARHLRESGCTKPLYITGYLESVTPHAQRLAGFRELLPNVQVMDTLVGSPSQMDVTARKVKSLIESKEIDGIAAVNDVALFSLLMRYKPDLPSVGYDASPLFSLYPVSVASIDIQSGELYRRAALMLLRLLSGVKTSSLTILPKLVQPTAK